jgi:glycosyltransferase involved in cell wall biosynthesis
MPEVVFELCELAFNLWETPRLIWRALRNRPDLLYARYSLFTFAPAFTSSLLQITFVLEVNDATFITRTRPLALNWIASGIEKYVFQQASLCTTISREFADLACTRWSLGSEKFVVLPNAVTPERFSPGPPSAPSNGKVLGVVGAFVPWHGLDFLIDAVAELRRSHPELRVVLVGDGPIRGAVEAQVKRLQLEEVVRFTGFVPPALVPDYLRTIDVCILPDSNAHGSPMKLFEYMAMAKPTVAPRYSPIADVIEDGETGLLFTPRDLQDFCRQTERLLVDQALAQKIGCQARLAVLKKHTWESNVRKLLASLPLPSGHADSLVEHLHG